MARSRLFVLIGIAIAGDTGVYGLCTSGIPSFPFGNSVLTHHGLLHKSRIQVKSYNHFPRSVPKSQTLRALLDVGSIFKGADPPPESVLRAVESAGRRVTGADVATAVGMSLTESQKALSTLAVLTGGTLQVSKDGYIVYEFDPQFRNILRARCTKIRNQFSADNSHNVPICTKFLVFS